MLVSAHSSPFHLQYCGFLIGMDGDIVARNIREFEKTHEDIVKEVWIVG